MLSLRSISLIALGLLAPASAFPHYPIGSNNNCLTSADANIVAEGWVQSIGNFSTGLVNALVTKQFTEWTESALSLNSECLQAPQPGPAQANPELESAIWTNRTTFELLQGSSAPYQASVLNVWNTCDTVIMRWKLTDTGSRPVNGIIVLETVPAQANNTYNGITYHRQINSSYYEFDNQAWVQNLVDVKNCKDPLTGKVKSG